ncbi:universal stress protein [Pseudonocardia abyssalis]|uniref:Universal stress protein n=1 Tax=Pseudonocardia abyssalis TaxID=2792008 RepID=A0ABS6UR52_9PSEU|nr:universal stress protein [Pseudonocardia abyssalis]MBW0116553.1 universal stress protein [Pseudonocardia abyssalis]MBW0134748.1 universal stress protein [Pseudonocardia abyssalis]
MGTEDGHRHDAVVGVDGSEHALHAVGWAATEAQLRGLTLRIVHAAPRPADPGATRSVPEILARAFTVARRAAPDVGVSTARSLQDPAASLLDAAGDAALLVVGMGGGDSAGGPLVGSVALDVSGRAPCPVAVVRGGPVPPRGPVLVGVDTFGEDGLHRDDAALSVAFADARRHGGRVIVLHARFVTGPRSPGDEQAADVAVRDRLRGELRPWTVRFPEVPVQVSVVHGNPAESLLRAAEGCRLVVLGTHGDGAYPRDLFGSTSREVLRRSPVTVLVVNPDTVVAAPDEHVRSTRLDHPHDRSVLF